MSPRTCQRCGTNIEGWRPQARFCSAACTEAARRQRKSTPPPAPPPRRPTQAVDDLEAVLWREAAGILGEGARTVELDRAMGDARQRILAAVAAFLEQARRLAAAPVAPVRLSYPEALRVLGLQAGATLEDARRSRRVAALRWHPDRNPGPEAGEQMRRINEAYEAVERALRPSG